MRSIACITAATALAVVLGVGACIVESRCANDFDCAGQQRCSIGGHCVLECERDEDCHVDGVSLGKRCVESRCEFLYDERVPAPNLCLEVVNPRSSRDGESLSGEELCLDELEGEVVLIYFGQLT